MILMSSSRRDRLMQAIMKIDVESIVNLVGNQSSDHPYWYGVEINYEEQYTLKIIYTHEGRKRDSNYFFRLFHDDDSIIPLDTWIHIPCDEDDNHIISKAVLNKYQVKRIMSDCDKEILLEQREKLEHPSIHKLLGDYEDCKHE